MAQIIKREGMCAAGRAQLQMLRKIVRFVSGHGFSRAALTQNRSGAMKPLMDHITLSCPQM